jgi:hypothetical protein
MEILGVMTSSRPSVYASGLGVGSHSFDSRTRAAIYIMDAMNWVRTDYHEDVIIERKLRGRTVLPRLSLSRFKMGGIKAL